MPKLRSPSSYGINSRNDTSDPPRHPHLRRHDREAGTHQAADRRGHHARKGVTRCKLKKVRFRPNPLSSLVETMGSNPHCECNGLVLSTVDFCSWCASNLLI